MFDEDTRKAIWLIARSLSVEEAALLAVAEVESAGHTGSIVDGRFEPVIRWEGHYFDRRLTGTKRDRARADRLASPTAGAIANPRGQAARWALLRRAAAIDHQAAYESASYGVGQVMGGHWKWLSFGSVDELVEMARRNVGGQVELMSRYIVAAGLVQALRNRDWTAFARGYNGPAFAKNAYHTKMAAAYARWKGNAGPPARDGMLRLGSRGARVRELQALLLRAGHAVQVDGDFGQATERAVKAFQQGAGLKTDGIAGPATMRALDRFRQGEDDHPGEQPVTEVPAVRDAGRGGVLVGLVVALRDQIAGAAEALTGLDADTATTLANWLTAAAGVIGIGLLAWAIIGFLRSRRTEEAP